MSRLDLQTFHTYNYCMVTILFPVLAAVFGIGCLIGAFYVLHKKRLIDDLPTSKTQGVFIGLVELKGTAESEEPITSYLAGVQCIDYAWQVDEHWSRTVHETYTDSKGHTHTRTRTESGWKQVAGGRKSIPFYLKDDTGIIRVVPDGADITGISVFNETCSPGNPLYYSKGPSGSVANSTHRRRFTETAVPLHTNLYIMGQAREQQDVVAPEIAADKQSPMFVISTKTEKQISSRYTVWHWFWLVLGLVITAGLIIGGSIAETNTVAIQPFIIAVAGYLFALLLGWIWTVYNSLVNLRHMVKRGWSQIDIQLKRRHDLIPNLVRAVEGYRTHERDTQTLLAEMRTQTEATPLGETGPDFRGLAASLRVVMERYPDLKANESFLNLQKSLIDTEQRIALARDYYNNIVTFYNTRLDIIPDRFAAAVAGMRHYELMAAADFERPNVQVKLTE